MTAMATFMAIIVSTALCRSRLLVVQQVARAMILFWKQSIQTAEVSKTCSGGRTICYFSTQLLNSALRTINARNLFNTTSNVLSSINLLSCWFRKCSLLQWLHVSVWLRAFEILSLHEFDIFCRCESMNRRIVENHRIHRISWSQNQKINEWTKSQNQITTTISENSVTLILSILFVMTRGMIFLSTKGPDKSSFDLQLFSIWSVLLDLAVCYKEPSNQIVRNKGWQIDAMFLNDHKVTFDCSVG